MLSSRSIGLRLSLVFATLFAGLGLYTPFFPVFLTERGLSPDEIALILFVPIVIRAVAAPFLSGLTDRRINPALFLAISNVVIGILFATTAWARGLTPFLLLIGVAAILQSASIPLSDALTIKATQSLQGLHYGRIRLWGSVAFFLANLGGGFLLAQFGGVSIPLAMALCTMAVMPVIWPLRGMSAEHSERTSSASPLGGFLILLLIATALIQASHSFLYAFGSLVWAAEGYSATMIGAIWALNILSEIALFWFFGSAAGPRFPAFLFILMGGGAALLRWAVMATGPNSFVLVLCQFSHGLTFAATHLGAIALLARYAPAGSRGRAQGMMSAINGAFSAVVTLGSGSLFAQFGAGGFAFMVPLALLGVVLSGFASWRQPQSARGGG